jgi:hypothetical protein
VSIAQTSNFTRIDGLDDSGRAALEKVRLLLPQGRVQRFETLRPALDTALAMVASDR